MNETAIFAGGCFWGMEELFRKRPGVLKTRVGYAGGHTPRPDYDTVKNGDTGHAEALEIVFDPARTSYRSLLEFFFQMHDPTTLDRQGNDRGSQYRSAIFPQSEAQERTAREIIAAVNASGRWPGRVVTEIQPGAVLYEAEKYHQNYLQRYPDGYSCHFVRPEWVLKD